MQVDSAGPSASLPYLEDWVRIGVFLGSGMGERGAKEKAPGPGVKSKSRDWWEVHRSTQHLQKWLLTP